MTSIPPGEAHKCVLDILKGKAPGYVKPSKTVVISRHIVRTPAGSPDIAWVVEQIDADMSAGGSNQPLDAVALRVQATFAEVLGMTSDQVGNVGITEEVLLHIYVRVMIGLIQFPWQPFASVSSIFWEPKHAIIVLCLYWSFLCMFTGRLHRRLVADYCAFAYWLQVKPDASFFAIGGDSFRAGRVIAALRKNFDVPLQVAVMYQHKSVLGVAKAITAQLATAKKKYGHGLRPGKGAEIDNNLAKRKVPRKVLKLSFV